MSQRQSNIAGSLSFLSERTHTYTLSINLPSIALPHNEEKYAFLQRSQFVAHRCASGLRANCLERAHDSSRNYANWSLSPEGGFFLSASGTCGSSTRRFPSASTLRVSRYANVSLCINCSTMDDYANRTLLHARLICFLATFFHLICHGELARREFEIYEVLPLSTAGAMCFHLRKLRCETQIGCAFFAHLKCILSDFVKGNCSLTAMKMRLCHRQRNLFFCQKYKKCVCRCLVYKISNV